VFQKEHKKVENSGRRAGTPNKKTADIKALAFKSAPDAIKELSRLAKHSQNEAVRVAAAKELLDRAIGKAVQPHSGEGGEAGRNQARHKLAKLISGQGLGSWNQPNMFMRGPGYSLR
jgi:hypothetical protein